MIHWNDLVMSHEPVPCYGFVLSTLITAIRMCSCTTGQSIRMTARYVVRSRCRLDQGDETGHFQPIIPPLRESSLVGSKLRQSTKEERISLPCFQRISASLPIILYKSAAQHLSFPIVLWVCLSTRKMTRRYIPSSRRQSTCIESISGLWSKCANEAKCTEYRVRSHAPICINIPLQIISLKVVLQ